MTELKRRSLLDGLKPTSRSEDSVPSDNAVAAVAKRHGIDAEGSAQGSETATTSPRRQSNILGRTPQFNVRLHPSTVKQIYAEANGRGIPIAQVIAEAIALLRPVD
ncbi:hypothetical protein [Sphingomonas sp. PvP056]|uniref:hypothetical protein n=1 Tax=Sphingomonas sp. PvP056 TaxID=3156392 RepID=UPI00339241FD